MKSIKFPDMFSHNRTNIVEDYDATLQNLKLLLHSEKGELFGDPYFGTSLRKFLFDQNDVILKDILIDDIHSAITLFMPQLKVDRKDIKMYKTALGELNVQIRALNKIDFQTNLYNIVLFQAEV